MKNLLPILTLFLILHSAIAQTNSVTGTVVDHNNTPIFGANVSIINTTKGTQTNENGVFEISNISDGNYTLSISFIGYRTKEVSFLFQTKTMCI
ncbi:carboxypeptidase-like regulatory domain-containing protein [Jejuia pallidilutea]|uniref:Ferrichrome-iron receptor n=1 Tax=Jejuia pallidilutea TaxID=504487 RepID=A0A090VXM8_9FLAO|nr:ferrichrome-iron receptor [Jejuia pallidilutea]